MIKDSNTRTQITIDKKLYEKVKEQAKKENRSINNYIINLIKKELAWEPLQKKKTQ